MSRAEERATGRPAAVPAGATAVLPDGSAVLSPADLLQVLAALDLAEDITRDRACAPCGDCEESQAGLCGEHADSFDQADAWEATAARLGTDLSASRPAGPARLAACTAAGDREDPGGLAEVVATAMDEAAGALEALDGIRVVLARYRQDGGQLAALEQIGRLAAGDGR